MNSKRVLVIALLLGSCSPIRGCVESEFTLQPDSRLPKWFSLPKGLLRNNVTVKLTYYAPLFPVDNAVIELVNGNGTVLSKTTGEMCWHPTMEKKKNQYGGFDSDSYPHYVYIRASGTMEVIEHIKAPTFRIIDEATLMKAALESRRCDEG